MRNARGQVAVATAANLEQRFWSKVDNSGDCWEWRGRLAWNGYGMFSPMGRGGRAVRAHRLAYELTKGAIPSGLCVLHSCDNRACVRPDHLSVGTARENAHDRVVRGRHFTPFNRQFALQREANKRAGQSDEGTLVEQRSHVQSKI